MENNKAAEANQKPLKISNKTRKPKMSLEFRARQKITGWLSNFKTSFISSQQITPNPTEDCMIFPWDLKTKTYDTSILESEFFQQSEFWAKHKSKIGDLFTQLSEVKNLDPIDIKTGTISSVLYTWIFCTSVFILLWIGSILCLTYENDTLGTLFWIIWWPLYFLCLMTSCVIVRRVVDHKLNKIIADRASEIYLITFEFNQNYFVDHNLYIHLGIYSAWVDISERTESDFAEDGSWEHQLLERSMMMDQSLLSQALHGHEVNMKSNAELAGNCNEIGGTGKPGQQNQLMQNSLTASYFFPTHKSSMVTGLGPEGLGKRPRHSVTPLNIGLNTRFNRQSSIPLHSSPIDRRSFSKRNTNNSIASPTTPWRNESPITMNRTGSGQSKFLMNSPRDDLTGTVIHELPEEENEHRGSSGDIMNAVGLVEVRKLYGEKRGNGNKPAQDVELSMIHGKIPDVEAEVVLTESE